MTTSKSIIRLKSRAVLAVTIFLWTATPINSVTAAVIAGPIASPATTPLEYYRGAVSRLRSLPIEPYLSYDMYQQRDTSTLTEEIRQRLSDHVSWTRVIETHRWGHWTVGEVEIGRHYLVPNAFLASPRGATEPASGQLPTFGSGDGDLKTIASVTAVSRDYSVRLLDLEQLPGCGLTAHLALTPIGDPERYNIREMWVRTSDFMLCRAIYRSHLFEVTGDHLQDVLVVDAVLGEDGTIASWHSIYTFGATPFGMTSLGDGVTEVDGTFSRLEWSDDLPSYYFDETLWNEHTRMSPAEDSAPRPEKVEPAPPPVR